MPDSNIGEMKLLFLTLGNIACVEKRLKRRGSDFVEEQFHFVWRIDGTSSGLTENFDFNLVISS